MAVAFACCAGAAAASPHWVGSWAAAQQVPEPANALQPQDLTDATLRQVVHLSLGGTRLRVRVSNAFSSTPLHLAAVHIGRAASPSSPAILPGTDRAATFGGATEVTVPAGAEYWSDPVTLTAPGLSDLAVSLYFDAAPQQQTGHPGSRQASWLAHGDHVSAPDLPGARIVEHWYALSGVDVPAEARGGTVVALGDSITDGYGAATNGNERWPDMLAARLQALPESRGEGVLNLGIGGNHVLTDGLGPSLVARFDRDVLTQSGVRSVILLEGVNDLGGLAREAPASAAAHEALVRQILLAYAQVVARGRAHGVRMIGGTVMPFTGSDYYHPDAITEADRQRVNAWIRTPGSFDAVIDFDKVMRDSARPERLLPAYDCGDHLHPSHAGYRAMAQAVPLALLQP